MSRLRSSLSLAAALGALALFAAPAIAQQYSDDEIVVTAPHPVIEQRERNADGRPIDTLAMSQVVYTDDLNLNYAAHRNVLRHRVHDAAVSICDAIEHSVNEPMLTGQYECVSRTVRETMAPIEYRYG